MNHLPLASLTGDGVRFPIAFHTFKMCLILAVSRSNSAALKPAVELERNGGFS